MMMVNSLGTSRCSAITFTPPVETSVMVQSRGNVPVPNWILAKLRHTRRSLERRFTNMSIHTHPDCSPLALLRFYSRNIGIRLAVPAAIDRFFSKNLSQPKIRLEPRDGDRFRPNMV